MNLAPLDSSRQAASFERKIFENRNFIFFANFSKIFISKEAPGREESNGATFMAVSCLITELWTFKISKHFAKKKLERFFTKIALRH
jgi:hypothetical protein